MVVSRPDDVPARGDRFARRRGDGSVVGVPASVAGRVVCAPRAGQRRADHADGRNRWWSACNSSAEILGHLAAPDATSARSVPSLAEIERLNARLEADNAYFKEEIKSYHDFDEIVGESATLRLALTRLTQVAPTNSTVLLLGETGTGKELFARALHERSRRLPVHWFASTARRFRRRWSRASCSAMKRARSRAPWRCGRGASSWPTAARSSSTKSAIWRRTFK